MKNYIQSTISLLALLLLAGGVGAMSVAELVEQPDSYQWQRDVAALGSASLRSGLAELAGDTSLGEGERLELLTRFAKVPEGATALLAIADSELALIALAEAIPDSLEPLLLAYGGAINAESERAQDALYLDAGVARPALLDFAKLETARLSGLASVALYDLFDEVWLPGLVEALETENRPLVVAVIALEKAEEAAWPPLLDALYSDKEGATVYASLIFTEGGQAATDYLVPYLHSPSRTVRGLAIKVITKLTGTDYAYMINYEAEAKDYQREGLPVPAGLE